MKLALEIGGTEADFTMPAGERLRVFLTNTEASGILFAHELVRESAGADDVKRDKPVMVIIGNPPYSGHSASKGEWIRDLLRGIDQDDQRTTTGNYFKVDGQPLGEMNPKWLNDDYVKFIRFAQWRIEQTGEGVLGFVTNHSYLDSPTFRGMRQSLMQAFDDIYLLDLHGNAKRKEHAPDGGKDENVFDIQQGVAIGLFVKRAKATSNPARVFHADLWGEVRLDYMAANTTGSPPNDSLPGRVWINRGQYFEGVTPETWTFTIGGYRPAEKRLKDRKNHVLSFNDITHYCTLCAALTETPGIMARIDETVAAHGDWPLIF